MRPDIQVKVKHEIMKLLEARFIRVANYPDWVANIVPVPRSKDQNLYRLSGFEQSYPKG